MANNTSRIRAQDHRLQRINDSLLVLPNAWDIPVRLFANADISLQREAVDELFNVLEIQNTVELLRREAPDFFDGADEPHVRGVVLTPDFHKGAGIPIGTVLDTVGFAVPQAIGNDVNCGMRLIATGLSRDQVGGRLDALEQQLRHIFFEGGRTIALTPTQREALLREGMPGLLDGARGAGGLLGAIDLDAEIDNLERMHACGGYSAGLLEDLQDYVAGSGGASYDSMIGSLGGGNHFAEIQYVRRIHDRAAAHAWGLREGQVVVMIHAGSLGLGHVANRSMIDAMRQIYPRNLPRAQNDIYLLPTGERFAPQFAHFRTAMRNAANFAFGNRFFLTLMVRRALEQAVGPTETRMIYDAPHNLMWEQPEDSGETFLHRKSASPAGGWAEVAGSAYAHWGEPVIVPGSMGTASFLLLGSGNSQALYSSCHGAGRQLSRGAAMKVDDAALDAFLRDFRVVTPVDPRRPDLRGRRDILDKWRQELKQEAPFAYKEITPVIDTLRSAEIAHPVAEFFPIMTVKG
ncbi:MAG TPA: RtcB family protein [Roseiflexaceae bacterium]|nr:RtcB family protein [Roseiflexaceae bacterium]